MEITGFGSGASAPTGQNGSALSSLTENLDNFLLLLTKQLQHQDPLSPLDTNEFTAQLVQFTNVEQAIHTNRKLDALIGLQSNNQAIGALAFLGTDITADSNRILLENGQSEFGYELKQEAAEVVITILDAAGKPVRVARAPGTAGEHSYSWDGKDSDGVALPDGVYRLQMTAFDAEGNKTASVNGIVGGQVTGIEMKNGEVVLSVGNLEIPASQIRTVQRPPTA